MRTFTTAEEKELQKADRAGANRVKKLNDKKSKMDKQYKKDLLAWMFEGASHPKEVTVATPLGASAVVPIVIKNPKLGRTIKPSSKGLKDVEKRRARGLSCRVQGVDYSIQKITDTISVKTCTCCQKTFNTNMFSTDNKKQDKLRGTCKDCDKLSDSLRVYIPEAVRKAKLSA